MSSDLDAIKRRLEEHQKYSEENVSAIENHGWLLGCVPALWNSIADRRKLLEMAERHKTVSAARLSDCNYVMRFLRETGMEDQWHPSVKQHLQQAIDADDATDEQLQLWRENNDEQGT